jgi:hypothetical protein
MSKLHGQAGANPPRQAQPQPHNPIYPHDCAAQVLKLVIQFDFH